MDHSRPLFHYFRLLNTVEIKHTDCLFQVMCLLLTNQFALFQHSLANFGVAKPRYVEIKHTDWLLQVM